MTDDPVEALRAEVRGLSLALRIVCFSILLAISALNSRAAASIPKFEQIFSDMLGGRPLPALTQWVVENQSLLAQAAIVVFVLGMGALMMRPARAVIAIAVLALLALVQFLAIAMALLLPLVTITTQISA